jgi:hypothetical protein
MALSPRLLIRMRSQVQVLAGPPPIVPGQSAAGTGPGALAAGLGRAGAARPSPPAPPVAPPGPPARPSGSATTTQRGRGPARGRQPRGGCRHLALQPAPGPPRSRPRRVLRTPAWPAWSLSGPARPPRPAPNPAARVRQPPPTGQRDVGSVARVPASATVDRAVAGSAAPGASTGSGGHGRPATATSSPPPPPEHGRRRTRPDRRGRHQTAGHRTGGQQTADRRTRWTATPGDRTPDGWTAGSGTPETGWVDTACWTPATVAVACLLAGWTTRRRPTARDRLDAPPGKRRLGEQPPGPRSRKDAEGTHHAATDGSGHRRDRQLPVVRRRPAGASAHCCPRTMSGRA